MVENTPPPAENQIAAPQMDPIPEQIIAAGKPMNIDFSVYVLEADAADISYEIHDAPEWLSMDANTGVLTGLAPKPELNDSYLIQLIVNNKARGGSATNFFRLEIIGTLLLGTPEGQALFLDQPERLADGMGDWGLHQFIQQLLNEHFLWVYFYDAENRPYNSGKFIRLEKAKSGWNIYHFENVIMINPGDKAYAQYGNRARLLTTLREVFAHHFHERAWQQIGVDGSDDDNVGRAWVVGQQLDMPMMDEPPTEMAEINYLTLKRLYERYPAADQKPKL